jgi:hypothetical protein
MAEQEVLYTAASTSSKRKWFAWDTRGTKEFMGKQMVTQN